MDLASALTDLRRKLAQSEHEEAFAREYGLLLATLQGALVAMKELALRQDAWLRGELTRQARDN